jgi:hypothetical protein
MTGEDNVKILIQTLPGFCEKKLQYAMRNGHNHAMPHTFQMVHNTTAKRVLSIPRLHTLLHLLLKVKKELHGCQFSSDDALHTASTMILRNISHGGFQLTEICMDHSKILHGIQSVIE